MENGEISTYVDVADASKQLGITTEIINRRLKNNRPIIKNGIYGYFQWRIVKRVKAINISFSASSSFTPSICVFW